jgi:hypothetical protein
LEHESGKNGERGERMARKTLKQLRKMKEKLLLPGAKHLLKVCKQKKLRMILLTLGMPRWQKQKVNWCGLKKNFQNKNMIFTETINTDKGKSKSLKTVLGKEFDGSESVLFNDQPDQTEELLKHFPNMLALLKWEKRDRRVNKKQFQNLQKKYQQRIHWSESLPQLTKILRNILIS